MEESNTSRACGRHVLRLVTIKTCTMPHFSILRPTLTDAQIRLITDKSEAPSVQMCDVSAHPQCLSELTNLLDGIDIGKKRLYPWLLVRTRLDACVFLISRLELAIRPIIPPTHTHESFYETRQRVFMSDS